MDALLFWALNSSNRGCRDTVLREPLIGRESPCTSTHISIAILFTAIYQYIDAIPKAYPAIFQRSRTARNVLKLTAGIFALREFRKREREQTKEPPGHDPNHHVPHKIQYNSLEAEAKGLQSSRIVRSPRIA